jgi:hypothetical protein
MTAAGIAFIAGGIATLICLRSVLFGRGKPAEGGARRPEGGAGQLESAVRPAEGGQARPEAGNAPLENNKAQLGGGNRTYAAGPRPLDGRSKRLESRMKQRPVGRDRQRAEGAKSRSEIRAAARREESRAAQREVRAAQRDQSQRDHDPALRSAPPIVTETAELILPTARRASRGESDRPETPRQYRPHEATPAYEAAPALEDAPAFEGYEVAPAYESGPSDQPSSLEVRAAPSEPAVILGDEESRPISVRRVDRSDRTYGDRVDGWIRPEYHDDPAEPPSGEYWTPLPMEGLDLPEGDPEPSARGYGWPTPVERLPAVPDYEPATGFDLAPVASEPTELVPAWPPMPDEERRVRLPRSWSSRDTKPAGNRFLENDSRRVDADQRFRAPTGEPERRRPRPRPRPVANDPDNVYVSRHAADPPH